MRPSCAPRCPISSPRSHVQCEDLIQVPTSVMITRPLPSLLSCFVYPSPWSPLLSMRRFCRNLSFLKETQQTRCVALHALCAPLLCKRKRKKNSPVQTDQQPSSLRLVCATKNFPQSIPFTCLHPTPPWGIWLSFCALYCSTASSLLSRAR